MTNEAVLLIYQQL